MFIVERPHSASKRLLIAASGTGGHVFPALATAECLSDVEIEWLGVPDRLERQLLGDRYPLHFVRVEGFQSRPGLATLRVLYRLVRATLTCRRLLKQGQFDGVFTTGGYIAAPAILAARSLQLPVILHESNAIPGKVTKWFARWCDLIAVGFPEAERRLAKYPTLSLGTPVRASFLQPPPLDLDIPEDVPLIVVMGGSQGAVAVNQLVRQSAPAWFDLGAWVVHLTGENDPDVGSLQHPHYLSMPFYKNVAALLQRADLAISRAGSGSLTELAITQTPAILIPFPYAAEDHQFHNAVGFREAGAAQLFRQEHLSPEQLQTEVATLLKNPAQLEQMTAAMGQLAIPDSAKRLADVVRQHLDSKNRG
ncbi:MAG: undecaprenyldiphospho-muramoylpentapeptide beta-N-acetylglucosaminyltransferase [Phormidium sp. GEM2.Bin31]|nr:undecaprenyldiphospho-muramoylpentapeptide beta-N-acetylglucosaminyltransferase [Phormidium sp. BM_Day4_Bin.17]TVR07818.1 MAG: undecaprenyldiphospho-muramoylpentapeptide beta-N-acetylglucosaminyltransferase [Phormidium sp. GEM2.Bin31]UCJ10605.1 MAG: undecaprenyldiphospho-muramoylpentapeptide beta-N-acetylglucosaminyltransferase [Phormidium sp. PBR-2020]